MPELAARIRAKHPGAYDDMDDATLEKAVLAKHPEYADLAKPEPAKAAASPAGHKADWVDSLPSAAGTVFSLAGGSKALPTGMALSALGGAAGEGARQTIRAVQGQWDQVPDSIGGQLLEMGKQGLGQGAMDTLGRGLGAAITPVAKAAYGLALRPAKALQKEYGLAKIVGQGFADRVFPSAMGEAKAGRLVAEGRDAATQIAKGKQTPINLANVLQGASDDQMGRAAAEFKSAGIAPPVDKITEQIGNVVKANAEHVTPEELLNLRRGADQVADPAFRAARMPGGAGRVSPGTEASIAKSMANAERKTLDTVLGKEFQQANATTRARSGVLQATKDAAMRPNMLTNLIAGGAGVNALRSNGDASDAVKQAALFRMIFSPTAQAGASFVAPTVAKYGPRVIDMATQGSLSGAMRDALVKGLRGQQ